MVVVAVSVAELQIPAARSLKEKRKVVRGLIDRIHHRFKVSIIESDYHDLHQRAEIAIAAVHGSDRELDRLLQQIQMMIDRVPEARLLSWECEYFEARP